MLKKALILAVVGGLWSAPVIAGNASMVSGDGTKLRIKCTNNGCKVTAKKPGQKWGVVEKTKKGGNKRFLKLEAKHKDMGFK